jgi:hypothetical protein
MLTRLLIALRVPWLLKWVESMLTEDIGISSLQIREGIRPGSGCL